MNLTIKHTISSEEIIDFFIMRYLQSGEGHKNKAQFKSDIKEYIKNCGAGDLGALWRENKSKLSDDERLKLTILAKKTLKIK